MDRWAIRHIVCKFDYMFDAFVYGECTSMESASHENILSNETMQRLRLLKRNLFSVPNNHISPYNWRQFVHDRISIPLSTFTMIAWWLYTQYVWGLLEKCVINHPLHTTACFVWYIKNYWENCYSDIQQYALRDYPCNRWRLASANIDQYATQCYL